MENHAVVLENVEKRYHSVSGETLALDNISFSVDKGEFVVLLGPSGCGKSTVLSLMAGLIPPSSGKIFVDGKDISEDKSSNVGYMFQHDHLFPWCSVRKNIMLGLRIKKINDKKREAKLIKMLEEYGLGDFIGSYPRELSGGMRQRVALIRTLALEPEILLLDEPFSALDYSTRIKVSDDIASIIRKEGKTVIMVTHDISEALSLADRILVFTDRPSKIKRCFKISLPGQSVIAKRQAKEFGSNFNEIWEEMENSDTETRTD